MDLAVSQEAKSKPAAVDYQTEPSRYKHWRLSFDPPVATLRMDVAEDGGIRPGYKLKLNSYDLGVDIELRDALEKTTERISGCSNRILSSASRSSISTPRS